MRRQSYFPASAYATLQKIYAGVHTSPSPGATSATSVVAKDDSGAGGGSSSSGGGGGAKSAKRGVRGGLAMMGGTFRYTVWDPWMILSQMATMQSLFYVSLGMWVFAMDFLGGYPRSLDHLFKYQVGN